MRCPWLTISGRRVLSLSILAEVNNDSSGIQRYRRLSKLGADLVKVEVRVSVAFLRDLFIELRVVTVSTDTLSGTF